MSDEAIQRVGEIPLIIYWLLQMRVHEIIDRVFPYPHANRQGLSYGQLAVLFLTYVLYLHNTQNYARVMQSLVVILAKGTRITRSHPVQGGPFATKRCLHLAVLCLL